MQPYEQNQTAYGTGFARTAAQVDQGLRAFMLGVYNNMVLGLAISALVALGVNMLATTSDPSQAVARMGGIGLTQFGATLYGSPLMWVVALAPLAFAISVIGVLIFAGLTAWDTQRLKEMYVYGNMDGEAASKASIFGALSLYLNFINMFQMLLSLFGNRNE